MSRGKERERKEGKEEDGCVGDFFLHHQRCKLRLSRPQGPRSFQEALWTEEAFQSPVLVLLDGLTSEAEEEDDEDDERVDVRSSKKKIERGRGNGCCIGTKFQFKFEQCHGTDRWQHDEADL
jgi:hypothetical protein